MGRNRDAPSSARGGREGAIIIIAALIVGVALAGGGYVVKTTANKTMEKLDALSASVADTKKSVQALAQAQARAAAPPQQTGPDPSRRYTVKTTDAPAQGSADAKIKLVAFSDFQ